MELLFRLGVLAGLAAILACSTAAGAAVPQSKIQARILYGPDSLREAYDYVIVGGGTAGLTVRDRLSEDGESEAAPMQICLLQWDMADGYF